MDFNKLPRPVEPKLFELWKKYQDLAFLQALYDSDLTNRPHITSIMEIYMWDITDWFELYHSNSADINHNSIPTVSEHPSPSSFQKQQNQVKKVSYTSSEQESHKALADRFSNNLTSAGAEFGLVYAKGKKTPLS